MAYEIKPKQLHLKSYYEIAGIEGEIRNPKLNFVATSEIKLFRGKYVMLHMDRRAQPHRNIENIVWWQVTELLTKKGYLVIQIGKGDRHPINAIQINTIAEPMLAYAISGCDLFIGIDSGPANIALATGRKMIIFHGSVNPDYIYPNADNVWVMARHRREKVCETPYCWHDVIGCEGKECVINVDEPPCVNFNNYTEELLYAINEML
jgi:ADP-heptose:LPS heptosyltransferase